MLNSYQALKLDAAYRPIAVVSSTEALVSHLLGKATILETYDREIKSPSKTFLLPSVIALKSKVVKQTSSFTCSTKNLRIRDDGICQYCKCHIPLGKETIDHVVPKCKGGKKEWTNVVLCCHKCNQKKGSKSLQQSGFKLLNKPKPLDYTTYLKKVTIQTDVWRLYLKF